MPVKLSVLCSSDASDGLSTFICESLIQPFSKQTNNLKYIYPAAPLRNEPASGGMQSPPEEAVLEQLPHISTVAVLSGLSPHLFHYLLEASVHDFHEQLLRRNRMGVILILVESCSKSLIDLPQWFHVQIK